MIRLNKYQQYISQITRGRLIVYIIMLIWTIQVIRCFLMGGIDEKGPSTFMQAYTAIYVIVLIVASLVAGFTWLIRNWNEPLIKKK